MKIINKWLKKSIDSIKEKKNPLSEIFKLYPS